MPNANACAPPAARAATTNNFISPRGSVRLTGGNVLSCHASLLSCGQRYAGVATALVAPHKAARPARFGSIDRRKCFELSCLPALLRATLRWCGHRSCCAAQGGTPRVQEMGRRPPEHRFTGAFQGGIPVHGGRRAARGVCRWSETARRRGAQAVPGGASCRDGGGTGG